MSSSRLANILPETKQLTGEARLLKPTTNSVPLLRHPFVRYLSNGHTLQLCVYYYLRAGALIRAPLPTLIQDLIALTVSQSLFCALCLPSAGNWQGSTSDVGSPKASASPALSKASKSSPSTPTGSLRKRLGGKPSNRSLAGLSGSSRDDGGPWMTRVTPTIFALMLSLLLPPVPLAALALVLGAPLYPLALLPHTLVLAVHVSILTTMPIFYTHGVSAGAWRDVVAAWLPFDEAGVWGGSVGALVGGWIGAIPMALDWDRDWQAWPCTVLWGAVLGWAVGRVLTGELALGRGRRIDLSVGEDTPGAVTIDNKLE